LSIKDGEKAINLVVSNMQDPPQSFRYDEIFEALNEGQFWFKLVIYEVGSSFFRFNVRGLERRGMMRLEIMETPTYKSLFDKD
jgi:hypothetical protein